MREPGMRLERLVVPGDTDMQFGRMALLRQQALKREGLDEARRAWCTPRRGANGPGELPWRKIARLHLLRPGSQSVERLQTQ